MQDKPVLPSKAATEEGLKRAEHLPFDFVFVSDPPTTRGEKQRLQEAMDEYLRQRVNCFLSPSDRATLGPGAQGEPNEAESDRISQALDEIILQLAPEFGWRLFYSDFVRQRLACWFEVEADGPSKLEKLGKQLRFGARARRGDAKLRITEEHRRFKDSIVPELKRLQNFLRFRQNSQNRALDNSACMSLAAAEIERPDCPYSVIQNNRASFTKLVSSTPGLLPRLVNGGVTPATFADEWVARVTNQQPVSARQAMSEAHHLHRRAPKRSIPQSRTPKL